MHLVTNQGDACLTPDGIKQANETAAFMKKYLLKKEQSMGKVFDEVILECSPFIRCIQTSSRIAKALGVKEVRFNYLCSEWQGQSAYINHNPIPLLEFKNNSKSALNKQFKLVN